MNADTTTTEPVSKPAPVTDLAEIILEVRTPLNPVIGLSSAGARGLAEPLNDRRSESLVLIDASGHLLALVGDVFEMAKSDAGRLSLNRAHEDLAGIIMDVLGFMDGQVVAWHLMLAVEIQSDRTRAAVDAVRIKQVILDLWSTAIGFTPEGGQEPGARTATTPRSPTKSTTAEWASPLTQHERVFEPFRTSRLPQQPTRRGTGLGLPSYPGHGSTFTVSAARRQQGQRAYPPSIVEERRPDRVRPASRLQMCPTPARGKTVNWPRGRKCPT